MVFCRHYVWGAFLCKHVYKFRDSTCVSYSVCCFHFLYDASDIVSVVISAGVSNGTIYESYVIYR